MILLLYHLVIFLVGYYLSRIFIKHKNIMFVSISSLALGLLISLPLTYILASVVRSLPLGVYLFIIFSLGFFWLKRKIFRFEGFSLIPLDIAVVLGNVLFSLYIMSKTFKIASEGTMLVARNAIFDFGHALSIIRSMSWGSNIPYTSPFVSGTDHLYHFMFLFWSAILEYFGMSINWAFNIPSIIGFTLLLTDIYYLGKEIFKKPTIGILAILFTVFHGGLLFVPFFQNYGLSFSSILRNPDYLFTGPFDGSLYSLFFTLNVFINQRHLGIALGFFFLLYMLFRQDYDKGEIKKRIYFYGALVGVFTLWHFMLTGGLLFVFVAMLLLKKKYGEAWRLVITASGVSFLFVYPLLSLISPGLEGIFRNKNSGGSAGSSSNFSLLLPVNFLIVNYGFSIIFLILGFIKKSKERFYFLPLFFLTGLFILISLPTGFIDQKFLNVLQVLLAFFTAAGVYAFFQTHLMTKIATLMIIPLLIISGIIDFMVIKNDYLFPVKYSGSEQLVAFIDSHTKKDAVFLSYQEIFDPVLLAGRKQYYGFFRNPGIFLGEADQYRADRVSNVFAVQDEESLRYAVLDTGVDYILLPPPDKTDLPYTINYDLFKQTFPILTEDFDHLLLDVRKTF